MKPWIGIALFALLATGCAGDDYADGAGGDGFASADAGASGGLDCFSSNECPTGFTCSEFGTCVPPSGGGDAGVPPEEVEVELSQPVSSERFVYVAMTELDSLAKVDGNSLEVSSVPVGDQPEVLTAIPQSDGVVVLDRNNGTVTIIRPEGGEDDVRVLPTLANMNQLSVDPTGGFALSWFDLRKEAEQNGGLGGVGQIGSFQDVTVMRLEQGDERAVDLTVGFRPREVEFDAAGTRAYVVSDDGISVIDLAEVTSAGPTIVPPVAISVDGAGDPLSMEVNVLDSGRFAVVREQGKAELRIVDLEGASAGEIRVVELPAQPTDVDLEGDTAYAVLRESAQLAIVSLDDGLPAPEDLVLVDLIESNMGSMVLSPNGNEAVLFTNAAAVERLLHIELQGTGFEQRPIELQKSVRTLGFDPSGEELIVLHAKEAGDPLENGASFEDFIDRSFGYSVVDVPTGFDKLQITPVNPGAFAFSHNTERAYVIMDGGDADGAVAETHLIELDTGVVRVLQMNSPPESVGILPAAGMAFVNQRHALGRVSFIDLVSGAMRTVTGFDLNSRIVD